MGVPDFRAFQGVGLDSILHSAKGSTWEKHKYIKIINGLYFYPDDYVGGRHISDAKKTTSKTKSKDSKSSSKDKKSDSKTDDKKSSSKLDKYADAGIAGKYGVGEDRKKKLGKYYDKIQNRVNQKLLGNEKAAAIAKKYGFKLSSSKKTSSKSTSKNTPSSKKKKKNMITI